MPRPVVKRGAQSARPGKPNSGPPSRGPKRTGGPSRHKKRTHGPTEEQLKALPSEDLKPGKSVPKTKKFGAKKLRHKRRPSGADKGKPKWATKHEAPKGKSFDKPRRDAGDKAQSSDKPKTWEKSKPSGKQSIWDKPQAAEKPSWDKPADKKKSWDKPQSGPKKKSWDKPRTGDSKKSWDKPRSGDSKKSWDKPRSNDRQKSWDTPVQKPKRPEYKGAPTAFASLKGVSAETAGALAQAGIDAPFPVQSEVIPVAFHGRDMLVKSPTGSGKTLAFGIPIIEQAKPRTNRPYAVVLTPTRELAVQISEDLADVAATKKLSVVAVYGGAPIVAQSRRAAKAAIIVATPGRLADLMRSRKVDLSGVRIVVLDEADRMLDMGFQPQVDEIVDRIPERKQTMLFSATLDGAVGKIAATYTSDPLVVRTSSAVGNGGSIEHILMATSNGTKVDTVLDALDAEERDLAVVFVRTKRGADRLCQRLREYGLRSTAIHGGMNQSQRLREYRRFQAGTCDTLVATDVFARGMDLDRITHVINYDVPEDADTYQHRSGRTGRAGRTGMAITMVVPSQKKHIGKMLMDAGVPSKAVAQMIQPSGKRWKQVPEAERFTDRMAAKDEKRSSRSGWKGEANFNQTSKPAKNGLGTVLNYDETKGFGFLKPSNGGNDVFFHRSSLARGPQSSVPKGATVKFELDRSADRERAALVTIEEGSRGGGNYQRRGGNRNSR